MRITAGCDRKYHQSAAGLVRRRTVFIDTQNIFTLLHAFIQFWGNSDPQSNRPVPPSGASGFLALIGSAPRPHPYKVSRFIPQQAPNKVLPGHATLSQSEAGRHFHCKKVKSELMSTSSRRLAGCRAGVLVQHGFERIGVRASDDTGFANSRYSAVLTEIHYPRRPR